MATSASYVLRCSNIYPTRCNVTQFILSGNCSTCFGWYHHPLSGAQTTVSTASDNCHTVTATCRYICILALVIQRAQRMRCMILSSVATLAVTYFSTYLINGTIHGGVTEHTILVDFLCNFCLKHFPF